ncbi:MAG: SpoIID/LytB domain-containing protein [Acidobacteria bacterium]|nr:SpoIID/LytB domain-containing protein [Acidobacteriota bacterium]
MNLRLASLLCLLAPLAAQVPVRIGLDTQAVEWQVSLEGGGEVRSRKGRPLLKVAAGEKLRIWWDGRGESDPTEEYRVQVGPPLPLAQADALMGKLRETGEQPDRVRVADGDTWRVLSGRFEKAGEAEPLLAKLQALGFEELWVASELRRGKPRRGRALYAVTERYERHALPNDGVAFQPLGELTTLVGKGRYRGRVEIFPNPQGRLTVVNTLDLETYLRGVVPREMGAHEYPALEALKAQAVAARTYAFANRGKRAAEGFDLLDTVADQVYGGRDGEQPMTDRAIQETAGLIATFQGRPIQALFMASAGGATVDNRFVFGGDQGYLKGVSSYLPQPRTIPFTGLPAPAGNGSVSWELLKLFASGALPQTLLGPEALDRPARASVLRPVLARLAERLGRPTPAAPGVESGTLFGWMARSLGLDGLVQGQERPQDGIYFLGGALPPGEDPALMAFLVRRGIAPPASFASPPTFRQVLQSLARMWLELEPIEFSEGTLLAEGQVRPRGKGPEPLLLAEPVLLAEEAPGGHLRLVSRCAAQVGDKVKWWATKGPSPVLIRRLDPDGASMDRYNPTSHWRVELKEQDLLDRLRNRAGIHSVRSLDLEHNAEGRVLKLTVRDDANHAHVFTGMRIRGVLGLKDNVFRTITVGRGAERRWIFYGRGWGHGVGMDQTGAYGFALEGWTFDRILKHYYTGIELSSIAP